MSESTGAPASAGDGMPGGAESAPTPASPPATSGYRSIAELQAMVAQNAAADAAEGPESPAENEPATATADAAPPPVSEQPPAPDTPDMQAIIEKAVQAAVAPFVSLLQNTSRSTAPEPEPPPPAPVPTDATGLGMRLAREYLGEHAPESLRERWASEYAKVAATEAFAGKPGWDTPEVEKTLAGLKAGFERFNAEAQATAAVHAELAELRKQVQQLQRPTTAQVVEKQRAELAAFLRTAVPHTDVSGRSMADTALERLPTLARYARSSEEAANELVMRVEAALPADITADTYAAAAWEVMARMEEDAARWTKYAGAATQPAPAAETPAATAPPVPTSPGQGVAKTQTNGVPRYRPLPEILHDMRTN